MKIAIGIDIGGTNTVVGVIDENGSVLNKIKIKTKSQKSAKLFFKLLYEKINDLTKDFSDFELLGIGIGAPNGNHFSGEIISPPNLNWPTIHVPSIFKNYTDLKIILTNDANSAALGEKKFGVASKIKNFVLITLGTGLGSGIFVNNRLVYGNRGFGGEMGHISINPKGRKCNCGKLGCLEMYVSAKGITETVKKFKNSQPDNQLINELLYNASLKGINGNVSGRQIDKAYDKGDPVAIKIYDYTAEKLGYGLSQVATLLEPEAFIFYGGISYAGDRILIPTKKYFNQNLIPFQRAKIKLLLSGLSDGNAGILGAASLIFNETN